MSITTFSFTGPGSRRNPQGREPAAKALLHYSRRKMAASVVFALSALAASVNANAVSSDTSASSQDLVARGKYIATAGDCMACHTVQNSGKPFAGGYGIESPLGKIYATNITPSKVSGIGDYSEAEFSNAVRNGIRRDGSHLYPAMPYTSYAKLTDSDVSALYVYFMKGVAPVDQAAAKKTDLPFPFNQRASMAVWNSLFLDKKPFEVDSTKSSDWNRGAYLADSLEHCGACHTPRNPLMAENNGAYLSGASLGTWYAPNITSDNISGIGGWSDEELFKYLKTGVVNGKAQAAGPMAEAIENSLQYLTDADLKALVTYLKATPAIASPGVDKPRYAHGDASLSESTLRGDKTADKGWQLFSGSCAACHQIQVAGTQNHDYPSLFHNTATGAEHPDNLISTILFGLSRTVDGKTQFMPAFGEQASYTERLSDDEIAAISNYVFKQYGNPSVKVSADDVATIRRGGPTPAVVKLMPFGLGALGIFVVAIILWIVARRRKA